MHHLDDDDDDDDDILDVDEDDEDGDGEEDSGRFKLMCLQWQNKLYLYFTNSAMIEFFLQWMTTTMVTAFWTRMKTMEMMSYNCSSVALNILKLFYNDWLIK